MCIFIIVLLKRISISPSYETILSQSYIYNFITKFVLVQNYQKDYFILKDINAIFIPRFSELNG